ncbi:MAG: TetR/AcrR family transcriptional regulator [Clostridia bacterium]|nr:TetR/AcrR family transcriptional regulator [Clostridia bacterium]
MPKIIENLREQLLAETKRQIDERGYGSTTVRSVANGCGVAVGTVYNYFKSKDMLIASFILKDWMDCLNEISEHQKSDRREYLEFIHRSLLDFADKHIALFSDKDAARVFQLSFSVRHKQLRAQLAEQIMPIANDGFLAEYVAEAMLCWTMAGRSFDEIYPLLPEKIK